MPRKPRGVLQTQLALPGAEEAAQSHTEAPEKPPKEPQGAVLGSTRQAAVGSYAVVGLDTSLTSIAAVALGYDGLTKKHSVTHGEIRWTPEVDYFRRLGEAARSHDLILDLLRPMWVVDPSRVFIAMEEPFPLGMLGSRQASFQASYAKQQAEVSGSVKGSLVRYGFENLVEVNNSSWHKALRQDGVDFQPVTRGSSTTQKAAIKLANKMRIKQWAIERYGLPDLPDLVASKSGAKIPRPESGYGAKAKAVQPDDTYDACAVAHWLLQDLQARDVVDNFNSVWHP